MEKQQTDNGVRPVRTKAVTLRALVIAALLTPPNIYWLVGTEGMGVFPGYDAPSLLALFFNCLFVLLILLCVNTGLKRFFPAKAFHPGELLVIYILLTGVTAVCGHGMIQNIVAFTAYPVYFGGADRTAVEQYIFNSMPPWMILTDPEAGLGFWLGGTNIFTDGHWRAWLLPILSWTSLLGILVFGLMCLSVIVRQVWADHERLSFPITQLPVHLVTNTNFFRNRALWAGIGCSSMIAALSGLHGIFPAIPSVSLRYWISGPGGALTFYIYPFVVGISFLMPVNLAFATWFFVLFQYFEVATAQALGLTSSPLAAVNQQAAGALYGLIIFRLIMERRYFYNLFLVALKKTTSPSDAGEAVSYRFAVVGFILSVIAGIVFCSFMGMGIVISMLFIGFYFLQSLGIGRIRAECGPPAHDVPGDLQTIIVRSLGTHVFSARSLVSLSLVRSFNISGGNHPMPSQLEGLQMSTKFNFSGKAFFWSMVAFMMFACVAGILIMAGMEHYLGAATAKGGMPLPSQPYWVSLTNVFFWAPLVNQFNIGSPPAHDGTIAFCAGGLFAIFLTIIGARFASWPLPALGFIIAQSWYINYVLWFSIAVAWFIKLVVLRYGGRGWYMRALPFFFGLIIGDCIMGFVWSFIGFAFNTPPYSPWF